MEFISLVSGGKDSIYNTMLALEHGHTLKAVLNLHHPLENQDSYMYQTVGAELVPALEECLGVPLVRHEIRGASVCRDLAYAACAGDEVEDLYAAVKAMLGKYSFCAVAVGAIKSTYQANRVRSVCDRLGLRVLSYLWGRSQGALIDEMISRDMKCVAVKVASMGLDARSLGTGLAEIRDRFYRTLETREARGLSIEDLNVCGEGGEYETFTLDCPIYRKRIEIVESEAKGSTSGSGGAAYLLVTKYRLVDKTAATTSAASTGGSPSP